MKNMQRGYLKIVAAFAFIIISSNLFGQTTSFRLKTADSLFRAKQYTQSFEHYREMLRQNQYTPAMLLKMAYIQEGLFHIGQSMYFLNLYYIATNDKTALEKMQELATKYNLEGYEPTDTDRFLSFYHDYHFFITLALAALMLLGFSFVIYTRRKLLRRPVVSFVFLSLLTGVMLLHLYYGEVVTTGIITNSSTYVMSGPSAGASVVKIIGDGHRVEIIGHHDVWLKVRWEGNTAYIKENALLPIRL